MLWFSKEFAHLFELINLVVTLNKMVSYFLTGNIGNPKLRSSPSIHPAAQASAGFEYPSGCRKSISGLLYHKVTTLGV